MRTHQVGLLTSASLLALALVAMPGSFDPLSFEVTFKRAFADLATAEVSAMSSATLGETGVDAATAVTANAAGEGALADGNASSTAIVEQAEPDAVAEAGALSQATAMGNHDDPVQSASQSTAGAGFDADAGVVAAWADAATTSTDPTYGAARAEGVGGARLQGENGDANALAAALAEIGQTGGEDAGDPAVSSPSMATHPHAIADGGASTRGESHSLSIGTAAGNESIGLAMSLSASKSHLQNADGDNALTKSWASANAIRAEGWNQAWAAAHGSLVADGDAGGAASASADARSTADDAWLMTKAGTGAWLDAGAHSLGTSAGTTVAVSSMNQF